MCIENKDTSTHKPELPLSVGADDVGAGAKPKVQSQKQGYETSIRVEEHSADEQKGVQSKAELRPLVKHTKTCTLEPENKQTSEEQKRKKTLRYEQKKAQIKNRIKRFDSHMTETMAETDWLDEFITELVEIMTEMQTMCLDCRSEEASSKTGLSEIMIRPLHDLICCYVTFLQTKYYPGNSVYQIPEQLTAESIFLPGFSSMRSAKEELGEIRAEFLKFCREKNPRLELTTDDLFLDWWGNYSGWMISVLQRIQKFVNCGELVVKDQIEIQSTTGLLITDMLSHAYKVSFYCQMHKLKVTQRKKEEERGRIETITTKTPRRYVSLSKLYGADTDEAFSRREKASHSVPVDTEIKQKDIESTPSRALCTKLRKQLESKRYYIHMARNKPQAFSRKGKASHSVPVDTEIKQKDIESTPPTKQSMFKDKDSAIDVSESLSLDLSDCSSTSLDSLSREKKTPLEMIQCLKTKIQPSIYQKASKWKERQQKHD